MWPFKRAEREDRGFVRLTSDGFHVHRAGGEPFEVTWSDVKEIVTYKRDLLTTDQICVAFRTADDEKYWEIDEELEGFDSIVSEMAERFTIPEGWREEVTTPPFATNLRTIYGNPWQRS